MPAPRARWHGDIEKHAHLGLEGDAGFRRFENLQRLLACDARVLPEEALERFALLEVIEQEDLTRFLTGILSKRNEDLSWDEVADMRQKYGPQIWSFASDYSKKNSRLSGTSLVQTAQEAAEGMHRRAKETVRYGVLASFATAGFAVAGPPGAAIAAGTFAHAALGLLTVVRLDLTLRRVVAKVLARGKTRFLLDTAFYRTAERRDV